MFASPTMLYTLVIDMMKHSESNRLLFNLFFGFQTDLESSQVGFTGNGKGTSCKTLASSDPRKSISSVRKEVKKGTNSNKKA